MSHAYGNISVMPEYCSKQRTSEHNLYINDVMQTVLLILGANSFIYPESALCKIMQLHILKHVFHNHVQYRDIKRFRLLSYLHTGIIRHHVVSLEPKSLKYMTVWLGF